MTAGLELIAPGVYDMPEEVYFSDPVSGGSLSFSGAKKLLPPSCPAIFHYEREHGRPPKREFDLGHAAHMVVLGTGPELYVVGGDDFRKKDVREERDAAYARGAVPLIPEDFNTVQAMATALRDHPRAGDLFTDGAAEQTLIWRDEQTGVMCRSRVDWLSRERIVDYKTTTDVNPAQIGKTIASFGYHLQRSFYLAGAVELDLVPEDADFLFVMQSKTPPYLVTVAEVDETAARVGYEQMRRALEVYRDCTEAGVWPGYSDDIETVSLPTWYVRAHERDYWT